MPGNPGWNAAHLLTNLSTIHCGTRLYFPVSRPAFQSLDLPALPWAGWLRISQPLSLLLSGQDPASPALQLGFSRRSVGFPAIWQSLLHTVQL
jgi:hypothetical protein